jgi:hypothetical protein
LHFLAFPATFLRHFFAATLNALRACFAVLIFEPLSFEIRHFLNPGFTRLDLRALRFLTIVLCPGEERGTHRPFILWHMHVTFHRVLYLIGKYIKVFEKDFENYRRFRLCTIRQVFIARPRACCPVLRVLNLARTIILMTHFFIPLMRLRFGFPHLREWDNAIATD